MIHIIAVWEAEGIAPVLLDTDQTSNNDQDNQANQHNGSSPDNDAHCRWSLTINYNTVNINADIKYEIRDLLEDQAAILPGAMDAASIDDGKFLYGWNTQADGRGNYYDIGCLYNSAPHTLYAEWYTFITEGKFFQMGFHKYLAMAWKRKMAHPAMAGETDNKQQNTVSSQ